MVFILPLILSKNSFNKNTTKGVFTNHININIILSSYYCSYSNYWFLLLQHLLSCATLNHLRFHQQILLYRISIIHSFCSLTANLDMFRSIEKHTSISSTRPFVSKMPGFDFIYGLFSFTHTLSPFSREQIFLSSTKKWQKIYRFLQILTRVPIKRTSLSVLN